MYIFHCVQWLNFSEMTKKKLVIFVIHFFFFCFFVADYEKTSKWGDGWVEKGKKDVPSVYTHMPGFSRSIIKLSHIPDQWIWTHWKNSDSHCMLRGDNHTVNTKYLGKKLKAANNCWVSQLILLHLTTPNSLISKIFLLFSSYFLKYLYTFSNIHFGYPSGLDRIGTFWLIVFICRLSVICTW